MGSKILSYGETAIVKSALHKKTISININKIEINRIVLKLHMVIQVHLSTTLGIDILMETFHNQA